MVAADLTVCQGHLRLITDSHTAAALVSAGDSVIGDDGAVQVHRSCAGSPQAAAFFGGSVAVNGHSADLKALLIQRNAAALSALVAGDSTGGNGGALVAEDTAAIVLGFVVADHAAVHHEGGRIVNTAAMAAGGSVGSLVVGNLTAVQIESAGIVNTAGCTGDIAADLTAVHHEGSACVNIDSTGTGHATAGDGTGNVVALFVGIGRTVLQRQDSAAVLGQLDGTTAGGCHDIMAVEAQIGGLAEGCHLGQLHILGQIEVTAGQRDLCGAGYGGVSHAVVIVTGKQLRSVHDTVSIGIGPADILAAEGNPAAAPALLVLSGGNGHLGVGAGGLQLDAATIGNAVQIQLDSRIVQYHIPVNTACCLVCVAVNDHLAGQVQLTFRTGHIHTAGQCAGGGVAGDHRILHRDSRQTVTLDRTGMGAGVAGNMYILQQQIYPQLAGPVAYHVDHRAVTGKVIPIQTALQLYRALAFQENAAAVLAGGPLIVLHDTVIYRKGSTVLHIHCRIGGICQLTGSVDTVFGLCGMVYDGQIGSAAQIKDPSRSSTGNGVAVQAKHVCTGIECNGRTQCQLLGGKPIVLAVLQCGCTIPVHPLGHLVAMLALVLFRLCSFSQNDCGHAAQHQSNRQQHCHDSLAHISYLLNVYAIRTSRKYYGYCCGTPAETSAHTF